MSSSPGDGAGRCASDSRIAATANVICDIDQLGRTNDSLKQLAESHKGTYLHLPDGQIQSWYAEYQQKKGRVTLRCFHGRPF